MAMIRLLKRVLVDLFVLWLLINMVASYFDAYCVIGRLSVSQSFAINELHWSKHAGKRDAGLDDRVIAEECSEFSRNIFRALR